MNATFPWLSQELEKESNSDSNMNFVLDNQSSFDANFKVRIRTLEEENSTLKRERSELLNQMMEQREALLKQGNSSKSVNSNDSNQIENESAGSITNAEDIKLTETNDRAILSKIIELENKLIMAGKKEVLILQH